MGIREQIKEQRDRAIREVGLYALNHPELSFKQVGLLFDVHYDWVSRAARMVGGGPRRPGRKSKVKAIEVQ